MNDDSSEVHNDCSSLFCYILIVDKFEYQECVKIIMIGKPLGLQE